MTAIDTDAPLLLEVADIRRRINRLVAQGASHAGFAKEIDYLLEHVAAIEKHLKIA